MSTIKSPSSVLTRFRFSSELTSAWYCRPFLLTNTRLPTCRQYVLTDGGKGRSSLNKVQAQMGRSQKNSRPAIRAGRLSGLEAINKRPRLSLPRGAVVTDLRRRLQLRGRTDLGISLDLVLQLTGVVAAFQLDRDLARQVMKIARIRGHQDADGSADRGQLPPGYVHRGRIGVVEVESHPEKTVCILSLHDLKNKLQVVSGTRFGRLHFAVGDDRDVAAVGDRFHVVGWFDGVGIKALEVGHCVIPWSGRKRKFSESLRDQLAVIAPTKADQDSGNSSAMP